MAFTMKSGVEFSSSLTISLSFHSRLRGMILGPFRCRLCGLFSGGCRIRQFGSFLVFADHTVVFLMIEIKTWHVAIPRSAGRVVSIVDSRPFLDDGGQPAT